MSVRPCPDCKGARLRPESRAVKVNDVAIHEATALSARRALEWFAELDLSETDRAIAKLILREIEERLRFLDNVGVGYLSMERASATLSGGEAQRIRLATQIGSSLVGVLYILDEPSIGLHQRDNERLIATLEAPARPRQHRAGRRARRGHDARRRPPDRHGPGRGRARRPRGRRRHRRGGHAGQGVADRPVPRRHAADRGPGQAPDAVGLHRHRGRDPAQPEEDRRPDPARDLHDRHRRERLGQVDARQRGALQGGRQPAQPRAHAPGRPQAHPRPRAARQDHLRRPVADRPHAALQPGHLHRAVRPDPRPLLQDAGGAGARLQARPLLVQRQGRALRGLPRRRPDQDRDALPARRLRAVRAVPRQALQPRDAGHPLQGQDDRRRARHVDRGGASSSSRTSRRSSAASRRCTTSGSTT